MKTNTTWLRTVNAFAAMLALLCQTGKCAENVEHGSPTAPPNAATIAGAYYRGDGLGMNISLKLDADGTYFAEWNGCLGKYGEAVGKWALAENHITFTPTREEGMLKGHLKILEVAKFKGDWIFIPTDQLSRKLYEDHGVSRSACYQKQERI